MSGEYLVLSCTNEGRLLVVMNGSVMNSARQIGYHLLSCALHTGFIFEQME